MRTILINYKGGQVETHIKSEWNELTWSDLRFVIEHFFGNLDRIYVKNDNPEEGGKLVVNDKRLLRSVIAGITLKLWDIKPNVFKEIPGSELDKLIDMYFPIKFLMEGNGFTKCPVKRVFHWGWYQAPGDDFTTVDFEEFCYADAQYYKFRKTRKIEDLDMFAAILLRKAPKQKVEGIEKRGVFNPQLVEKRLPMARSLSYERKLALWLWWEGCRQKQAKIYKDFFKKGDDSGNSGGSLFNVMLSMSKDIFGPLEQTKRVNCKLAFARMDQLIKQSNED